MGWKILNFSLIIGIEKGALRAEILYSVGLGSVLGNEFRFNNIAAAMKMKIIALLDSDFVVIIFISSNSLSG